MSGIWYMVSDQNKYVYHYTRSATLVDYILPTKRLRFSRFERVNDPREMKNWTFSYHSTADDLDPYLSDPIDEQMNRLVKHQWRVGCFVSDPPEALVTSGQDGSVKGFLTAPYERGHSRPRMWAQYGEDYKGACLVFDKARLHANVKTEADAIGAPLYAGKVSYRNPRIVFSPDFSPMAAV